MLISDWSSDVCSSDLCLVHDVLLAHRFEHASSSGADESAAWVRCRLAFVPPHGPPAWPGARLDPDPGHDRAQCAARRTSEELRLGTECVSTGRSRWPPDR